METISLNREAYDFMVVALEKIKGYYQSHNKSDLQEAENALERASKIDPNNLEAIYYKGITKDLLGEAYLAVPLFQEVISKSKNERLIIEAKYNLGVVNYHQYSQDKIENAVSLFNEVINHSKDLNLKLISLANLAQAYAMRMIPSYDQKYRFYTPEGKKEIISYVYSKFTDFEKADSLFKKYYFKSIFSFKKTIGKNKIVGFMRNARGMAYMYYVDYADLDVKEKRKLLMKSLNYLLESEKSYPNDWANNCDLGSVHMRIANLNNDPIKKKEEFEAALMYLQKVVTKLRVNYGFGLYEIGRVYRLMGKFEESLKYFESSLHVPKEQRDVGDKNLNYEIERAKSKSLIYP